jgi:CheY-like chemotaxis protein
VVAGTASNHAELACYYLQEMRKIAVVDDNADNRLIIRTILEDQYEILEYSSGIEAIEDFRKNKPDVVILDISLPEMDGTEILRRLRDDSDLNSLPVIALTAHAMVGDREKYLAAGFNDYVAKPILDMSVLFSTIQRWVAP